MKRCTGLFLATLALAGIASAQQKQRVAVMNFEYGTVQSSVSSIFGVNRDIGKGIADIWSTDWFRTGSIR
jgi:hypothetical protein